MAPLKVSLIWQIGRRYATWAFACFCGLGLVTTGHGQDDRVAQLISRLGDRDSDVQQSAVDALIKIGAPAVGPLIAKMKDTDANARRTAALGEESCWSRSFGTRLHIEH